MYRQYSSRTLHRALRDFVFLGLCFASANASASSYTVNIDTSALLGQTGQLVFDFIDGGPPTNSVTISAFTTDGTLGAGSGTGGSSGSLASSVSLVDTDPLLNGYMADITLGNHLHFVLNTTDNAPQAPNSSPDGFSFYLLNTLGDSLTTTADPSGLNALLVLNIDGTAAPLAPYSGSNPAVPVTVTAVPIPPTALLFGSGLLVAARRRRAAPARPENLVHVPANAYERK